MSHAPNGPSNLTRLTAIALLGACGGLQVRGQTERAFHYDLHGMFPLAEAETDAAAGEIRSTSKNSILGANGHADHLYSLFHLRSALSYLLPV